MKVDNQLNKKIVKPAKKPAKTRKNNKRSVMEKKISVKTPFFTALKRIEQDKFPMYKDTTVLKITALEADKLCFYYVSNYRTPTFLDLLHKLGIARHLPVIKAQHPGLYEVLAYWRDVMFNKHVTHMLYGDWKRAEALRFYLGAEYKFTEASVLNPTILLTEDLRQEREATDAITIVNDLTTKRISTRTKKSVIIKSKEGGSVNEESSKEKK